MFRTKNHESFCKKHARAGSYAVFARKARILLKKKKAKVVDYRPFTIQLCYPTGEAKQEVIIGIDQGAKHIGVAVVSQGKVLVKGEVELRQDVHSLLQTRAEYRRGRRYRKTRECTSRQNL